MKADLFSIHDFLRFLPNEGKIHLGKDRAMLFRQNAFKTLRSLMLENLGEQTTHSILFKFGFNSAADDYQSLNEFFRFETEEERLAAGPLMHAWLGIVQVEALQMEIDRATDHFYFRGRWHHSFEAEIYKKKYGLSKTPVCYSLAGYGSGWCSAFFGRPVIEIETKCMAQGHPHCEWEIKPLHEWGSEAKPWIDAWQSNQTSIYRQLEESRQELQNINEVLERKVHERTENMQSLLHILCHDVKEPVHAILDQLDDGELAVPTIRSAATRILEIIGATAHEQKTQQISSGMNCSASSPNDVFFQARPFFNDSLRDKALNIEYSGHISPETRVWIDKTVLVKHILPNIVHNAIKYSLYGGTIRIHLYEDSNAVHFEVEDNGYGIPADSLKELLHKPTTPQFGVGNKRRGQGLGLHLVHKLVNAMEGKLTIQSKHILDAPTQHGTTVKLQFPVLNRVMQVPTNLDQSFLIN